MKAVIVRNPLQGGATDGAIGAIEHLEEFVEGELQIEVIEPGQETSATDIDIVVGVGPDQRNQVLSIYNNSTGQKPFLLNIKDPHYHAVDKSVDDYAPWDLIIDTMNTLKMDNIDLSDILLSPTVPPFSLTEDKLSAEADRIKKESVLDRSVALFAIGGPDPFFHKKITDRDVKVFISVIRHVHTLCPNLTPVIVTSKRTPDNVVETLKQELLKLISERGEEALFSSYTEKKLFEVKQMEGGEAALFATAFSNPYYKLITQADLIVVTDDSLSMMAELSMSNTALYSLVLSESTGVGVRTNLRQKLKEFGMHQIVEEGGKTLVRFANDSETELNEVTSEQLSSSVIKPCNPNRQFAEVIYQLYNNRPVTADKITKALSDKDRIV